MASTEPPVPDTEPAPPPTSEHEHEYDKEEPCAYCDKLTDCFALEIEPPEMKGTIKPVCDDCWDKKIRRRE